MIYNKSMEFTQDILEYYDELFPVSQSQKDFFFALVEGKNPPPRVLSIGCGGSNFEHILSRKGCDVTGIDDNSLLLEAASRRRRIPGVTIRFFKMSMLEMARFLAEGFYSVVYCINNRISGVHDDILMKKFFFDCKKLLAKNGKLILQLPNYLFFTNEPVCKLPSTQSIRAKLHTKIFTSSDGEKTLLQQVETSSGKLIAVTDHEKLIPITTKDIEELAMATGFTKVEFFNDYDKSEFKPKESKNLIAILS